MDRIHVVVDTDALIDYFAGISSSAEAIAHLLKEDRLRNTQHFSRVRGLKLLTAEDILKGSE